MNTNLALNHVTIQTSTACPTCSRAAKQPDLLWGQLTLVELFPFLIGSILLLWMCAPPRTVGFPVTGLQYVPTAGVNALSIFASRQSNPLIVRPPAMAERGLMKIINVAVPQPPLPLAPVWLPACWSPVEAAFVAARHDDVNVVWKGYRDTWEMQCCHVIRDRVRSPTGCAVATWRM